MKNLMEPVMIGNAKLKKCLAMCPMAIRFYLTLESDFTKDGIDYDLYNLNYSRET